MAQAGSSRASRQGLMASPRTAKTTLAETLFRVYVDILLFPMLSIERSEVLMTSIISTSASYSVMVPPVQYLYTLTRMTHLDTVHLPCHNASTFRSPLIFLAFSAVMRASIA